MTAADFFPSRTVTLYMARMFLMRTFAIVAGLVLVLQTLDLLSEAGDVLAFPGNGEPEVWRYVSLRAPQIVSFVLPFSVLLGTIITFMTMNQNSEIIALKASGLSAHQILAPLIVASVLVAGFSFFFNERITARATATLAAWEDADYGPMPIDRGDRSNVWVRDGGNLVQAAQVHGRGEAVELRGITAYEREGGSLRAIIKADRGKRSGNGWVIQGARRFDLASGTVTPLGNFRVAEGVRPDQFTLTNVNPDAMTFGGLKSAIEDLRLSGRPTKSLEGSLWHKLSAPLSALLMPLLGAVAAFGIARSGRLFVRAVIGMALGFAYFVADSFALAMGNLGAYPPFLAAWAPFLMFLLIGEAVLMRTEE